MTPSRHERLWAFQTRFAPYLFCAPFVILFCVFMLYPLGHSIVQSFYKTAGPRKEVFVGLANYRFLFTDLMFWLAVANTVGYTILLLCVQIPASLGLALVLNSKAVRARGFFRFTFFTTHLVGNVFVAVLFSMLLSPRAGLINRALGATGLTDPRFGVVLLTAIAYLAMFAVAGATVVLAGWVATLWRRDSATLQADGFLRSPEFRRMLSIALGAGLALAVIYAWLGGLFGRVGAAYEGRPAEINWLGRPEWVMPAVLIAALWMSVGFGMIYFLAALQGVDKELYEAAEVDGAGKWSQFWNITIPGIWPVLVFMVLIGTIGAFQLFELPYVLFVGPGPNSRALTIVMYLYMTGFEVGDLGYAAAIGWVLVLLILGVALLQLKFSRANREA